MPAHSKNLTERTTLRYTAPEAAILAKVVQAHEQLGIKISTNDAIRLCIRRAALPLPSSPAAARRAVDKHISECDHCTMTQIRCPDGWMFVDAYGRVTGTTPADPVSPAHDPAPAPQEPVQRTATGRRPLRTPQTKAV